MITIRHNHNYIEERKYIYDVIFGVIFGIDYQLIEEARTDICLELDEKCVMINDTFFQMDKGQYLSDKSLPMQPLFHWIVEEAKLNACLTNKYLPIIYGRPIREDNYIRLAADKIELGIDIFGSAFFMMTRYEEVVKKGRDEHDRFSAKASLAYQEGFLERPIINEYLEILWWVMKQLWPEIARKERKFSVIPTHDVDAPFGLAFLSTYQLMHTLAGDLIKRRSVKTFLRRLHTVYQIKQGNWQADDYYTFDLIMNISEENEVKSRFYFMNAQGLSDKDGNYDLRHPKIITLMKSIRGRGHEIGLHPSYTSYKNSDEMKRSSNLLREVLEEEHLRSEKIGGRQHYLRWLCPETWQHYEDSGISYDTTLSYADHIGFRCGICYAYPVFNVQTKKRLKLIERPLIVMECSALDERYMNLSHEEMLERCLALKEKCKKYNGDFVVLWHNSRFVGQDDIKLYRMLIK